MIEFGGRGILLDVEGTTSSVDFVYKVLFPFARTALDSFLEAHWTQEEVRAAAERIARDAGAESLDALLQGYSRDNPRAALAAHVHELMDRDAKLTGLKQLQGLIWRSGFEDGRLQAHVYDEVPDAMRRWRERGIDIRIYSSGSVGAQKLFFGHTIAGDLGPLISGNYDTQIGKKGEAGSYRHIANDWRIAPGEILFLSDVVAELNAARESGLQTGLVVRASAETPPVTEHVGITSFDQVHLLRSG